MLSKPSLVFSFQLNTEFYHCLILGCLSAGSHGQDSGPDALGSGSAGGLCDFGPVTGPFSAFFPYVRVTNPCFVKQPVVSKSQPSPVDTSAARCQGDPRRTRCPGSHTPDLPWPLSVLLPGVRSGSSPCVPVAAAVALLLPVALRCD